MRNPKFEYQNPKQIRNPNDQNSKLVEVDGVDAQIGYARDDRVSPLAEGDVIIKAWQGRPPGVPQNRPRLTGTTGLTPAPKENRISFEGLRRLEC